MSLNRLPHSIAQYLPQLVMLLVLCQANMHARDELIVAGDFEGSSTVVFSKSFGSGTQWTAGASAPSGVWLTRDINTSGAPVNQRTWHTDIGQTGDFYASPAGGSGPGTFFPVLNSSPLGIFTLKFDYMELNGSARPFGYMGQMLGRRSTNLTVAPRDSLSFTPLILPPLQMGHGRRTKRILISKPLTNS